MKSFWSCPNCAQQDTSKATRETLETIVLAPRRVVFNEKCHFPRLLTTSENESVLDGEMRSGEQTKSVKISRRKDFKPVILKRDVLRKVRSVVGISVMPFTVGWAKIDLKDMRLLTYTSEDIGNENVNYTETFAYKEAKRIRELIPESDLYIMERSSHFKKFNTEMQFKIILSSMLAVLLHDPLGPAGEENVLFQNEFVINYLYKLVVNKERVSAGQVLQRILGGTVAQQLDNTQSDISLSVEGTTFSTKREFVQSMFIAKPTARDASAVALFLALSFISSNPIEK